MRTVGRPASYFRRRRSCDGVHPDGACAGRILFLSAIQIFRKSPAGISTKGELAVPADAQHNACGDERKGQTSCSTGGPA